MSLAIIPLALCTLLLHEPSNHGRIPAEIPEAAIRAGGFGGLGGGGPLAHDHTECITPENRAEVEARIAANRLKLGLTPPHMQGGATAATTCALDLLYPFYPMAAKPDSDVYHFNYVDLDPSHDILDYNCNPFTYNGHGGIDTLLRSFAEQAIGVPIIAALDGVVIDAQDGTFDMNTFPTGEAGNYVIIDHGLGREAWYFHLKKDSVAVQIGDFVKAGQQIGLTASSGNSSWPHLHFETRYLGSPFEPFAGPCRSGPSWWENQDPYIDETYLTDFGITSVDLFQIPGLPHPFPAFGQISTSDDWVYLWFVIVNIPQDLTWQFKFYRPNGTLAYDSGVHPFGYPASYRGGWLFFYWWIDDMHTITGLWHIDVYFGGKLMVHAPIEVVTTVNPSYNRPPEPITVAFDPPAPFAHDVLFCRVGTSAVLDDLDYDVVRYRYEWKLDGQTIRDVVLAGHADTLPRDTTVSGQTVTCTVTPNDGKVDGPAASVSTVVTGALGPMDSDADGDIDLFDFALFQQSFTGPK